MTNPKRGAIHELLALPRPFRTIVAVPIALGMVGGLAITLLLANINNVLHSENGLGQGILLSFGGLRLLALVSSIISGTGTSYVSWHIIAELCKELDEKVLSAPIKQTERYRTHRPIPVLTHDTDTVSDFSFSSTPSTIALTVTFGCLGYLAHPSAPMFLLTVVAIIVGTVAQYLTHSHGFKKFYATCDLENELQKHYTAIALGAGELCIHRPRRYCMHIGRISEAMNNIRSPHINSVNIFILAKTFGSMLFPMVIGLALTLQACWPPSNPAAITGFVIVPLHMKGPLEQVVTILPIVSRAQVAFQWVAKFPERFSSPEPHLLLSEQEVPDKTVDNLELYDAHYSPLAVEDSEPFHPDPINLRITQGDIIFIVDESGCDEATLIRPLLGLYRPQLGEVLLNGEPVGMEAYDSCRQLFSIILANYYLFDGLVQGKQVSLQNVTRYLQHLEIAHKVSVMNGNFSTTDLSTGQCKCLALTNIWLEEWLVLVSGEQAVDQDPAFRRVFYAELLLDLKRRGKTIIVISHDDRYFEMADQLIRLSVGKIVKEIEVARNLFIRSSMGKTSY